MGSLMIGIAGGTASGKTTTAEAVAARLGPKCVLIHHDRYYRTMPTEYLGKPTAYNFDHPDSLDTDQLIADLEQLQRGHSVSLPRYDFAQHRRSEETDRVSPCPVFLIEGILVLADSALRERFHKTIFVHAAEEERLRRRIARDRISRGRSEEATMEQWERTVSPMHHAFVEPSRVHADLVIDGMSSIEAMVAAVLDVIGPI
jgi:uridine kinase